MLARWEKRLSTRGQATDGWLLLATFSLLLVGWIMVTSASSEIATSLTGNPYYFSIRHGIFVLFSVLLGLVALCIPLERWRSWGPGLLLLGIVLLIAVLLIGHEVNGSKRWIPLGFANIQASEVAKFCLIVYFADYLQRYLPEVRRDWGAFLRPFVVLGVYVALLIFEPDYGAVVVIGSCMMGMLLMSGAPLGRFGLVMIVVVAAGGLLAVAEPYRLERITSFANPWADQYSSGYQLTQALIAFGRGHWLGLGLGNSVQKLFYLPEAHTDFVFAVLAEELGLIGAVGVVCMFALLVFRGLRIGRKAELRGWAFSACLCYGISLVFGAQAFINIAVSTGMLPTKGLTLPLLSYGGSSLAVSCVMVALLLRVDAEMRAKTRATQAARQAKKQERGER
ncbi:putative lipid II flippase FtsW [Chromohalobacter sarecensis]|uniref:Probable peptidoglycan glycosyltransferase FtsW n=1 Tax=Chromohalobacter sarecensis TaxID=245294 RepID=A0ABV9D4A1_9GAMM|nr:putative lipid II flippase FtsW [Chromohalobacter sarecensis]MCK0714619.1 putative lipid II flippase FtsW [Chromohalobacter sarecensis]